LIKKSYFHNMNDLFLKVHPSDNVAAALKDLSSGKTVEIDGKKLKIVQRIPAKQKFALKDLRKDADIIMYGVLVGKAEEAIPAGGLLAPGNVAHATKPFEIGNKKIKWDAPDTFKWMDLTFKGYHRMDGKVGTMNYWLVIPLVFCENRNTNILKSTLSRELGYQFEEDYAVDVQQLVQQYRSGSDTETLLASPVIKTKEDIHKNRVFPNVDGIKFLTHEGGCGGTREDSQVLCELLAGYVTHPNVAGATILSLGCQHAQVALIRKAIEKRDANFDKPLFILEQQGSESERAFIAEAVKKTFVGLIKANEVSRRPASLDKLVMGVECGGSDGFSGISANPALGYASDLLATLGGSVILSEFPELNGVEQELINRCTDKETAQKFADITHRYAQRAESSGASLSENPSPGNIREGLITNAIKSAGAAKKGGTSPVRDVLDYAEPVKKSGLNLLCTPGNYVESTTGLAGSGANVIVFTTGMGTPTGNPIAPVVKVSSNTQCYEKMGDIIDIDAGTIIDGKDSIKTKGEEILNFVIRVASGEAVPRAVALGQDDFIPWKRGISL